MTTGLITTLPLSHSMVLPWIDRPPFSRFGVLRGDQIRRFVDDQIAKFAIRAAGAERATRLVNAVLRRLADSHAGITPPTLENDPMGHLMHALSLPEWIAARWMGRWGKRSTKKAPRSSRSGRRACAFPWHSPSSGGAPASTRPRWQASGSHQGPCSRW